MIQFKNLIFELISEGKDNEIVYIKSGKRLKAQKFGT